MKYRLLLIFIAAGLSAFLVEQMFALRSHEPRIYFLDVGQGDSELVIFPNGEKILTDAGPGAKVTDALAEVLPTTDRYIDIGIITHAQLDHYGGFSDLLEQYRFGAILWNGRDPDKTSESWERLKSQIREVRIPLIEVGAGDRIRLEGGDMEILTPTEEFWGSSELNDGCIVARVRFARWSALFTCDAGFAVEEYLERNYTLASDVLKVGHHGSKYSSSLSFLSRVSPALAVIEVGRANSYGHPNPEALARLLSSTRMVYRTDEEGTIRVEEGGLGLSVSRRE